MKLHALQAFFYDGAIRQKGEVVDVEDKDAELLIGLGHVRASPEHETRHFVAGSEMKKAGRQTAPRLITKAA